MRVMNNISGFIFVKQMFKKKDIINIGSLQVYLSVTVIVCLTINQMSNVD